MWNLKRLPSNVLCKVNFVSKENVRMATKKTTADEKLKTPKKGFFRRSESVAPDNYGKNLAADSSNADSESKDNRKVIRRSSMICSEGFDKYTFDCHRQAAPGKSAKLELNNVATQQDTARNQNIQNSNTNSENNTFANAQSFKPASVEQTAVRKISPFNPLSALSVTSPGKNVMPFKRVPEETIPANAPLSYKRVPEETIPLTNNFTPNTSSDKSPVTTIPLSFNPAPEEAHSIVNTSSLKTSPNKSAPVKNPPFSFKNTTEASSPVKNAPLSFKPGAEKSGPIKNSPFPFKNSSESSPVRNVPLSFKPVSDKLPPVKSPPFSYNNFSDESTPVRNAPLSFKNTSEKSRPVTKALSFRSISDDPIPGRNAPLSLKRISNEFAPSRTAPLSFSQVPEKTVSSNYGSDKPIPIRNTPLTLKGESVSLRNIPSSLKYFNDESSSSSRNIPFSLQPVPEEPAFVRDSTSLKNISDEQMPYRNSPVSIKPILTKHMSLLKKKTPSFKSTIIKRDSVVHPGRVDMQGSLFIDGRFQNPWPTWKPPTFANLLKFGVTRNKSKVPPKQELDLVLPIVKQNFSKLSMPDDGIRVTWIGHSTVLIQMHGLNILTDPIFSDRASPSQVVGPKRYRDPPCTIHDLPHINAVVISHSHYDHLDHTTVTLLNARFGSDIRWFVPLGLHPWMNEVGCENVVELDWWEENCVPEHSDTFFVFTPAQHWSKRAIGDDNKVLWGSWCILGPKYKFFFAGDTGYCEVFKQIGRVHGPFDLSAIPIGAYEPRWFMKYQHVNPEEAVKIHMDVKSKKSLAIHWGTFSLANEYYLDPPVRLRESLDKYEVPPELFFTMKHGESRLISQNTLVKKYPLNEQNSNNS